MPTTVIFFLISLFLVTITFWLVYAIKKTQNSERQLQRFLRDHGVVCYEFELWEREFSELIQDLQTSGLLWYWHSTRHGAATEKWQHLSLPEFRDLTVLSSQTKHDLHNDLLEENESDYRRSITLYGFESGDNLPSPLDMHSIKESLTSFVAKEEGPLKIVINQITDSFEAHLFVPHSLDPKVERLLETWDVLPNTGKYKTRAYKRLNLAALERQFRLSE